MKPEIIAAANILIYAGHVNKVIADHSLGKPNAFGTLTCGRKPDYEEIYDTGNDRAMQNGWKKINNSL